MANLIYRISVTPNTPTTTYSKNAPLTNLEIDGNFKSLNDAVDTKAGLNSPSFTGVPSVPNAAIDTATTQIASTSFVVNQGYLKIDVASITYAPLASPTFTGNVIVNSNTAVKLPVGTTTERPTGATGLIRYNTELNSFEGYSAGGWGSIGGGATGANGNPVFWENDQTVTANYTITAGKNAGTFGPVTIANGATVTIPDNSNWTIV